MKINGNQEKMIKGLSFLNGDWYQEPGDAPIMPFDYRYSSNSSLDLRSPIKLVSFWVTDVDHAHRSKNSIWIGGVLQMGMTLEGLFLQKPDEESHLFDVWPGHSQLSVNFQGVYTESKKNHGERVICLIGSTMLPARQPDSVDPWEWVKESGYSNQPPLVQHDKIQLVLRYPSTFTLTSRAIIGNMRSLSPRKSLKYFNEIQISSWQSSSADYEFAPKNILISRACDPYPFKDIWKDDDVDVYKGLDFCEILRRYTHLVALTIVPNWKCNGTDDYCSKLGPFMADKEIRATNGSFRGVKLVMQDVKCQKISLQEKAWFTRISSVFRAVPPSENQFSAAQRTGLSNMTLLAEGVWNSSSGQLCMVGCLGISDEQGNGCDTRVCVYIPLTFSIRQRSIIMGSLSSLNRSKSSYFPLSFEKLIRPAELRNQFSTSHAYYKYSKLNLAGVVLEKYEPFNFEDVTKKSLLKYPKLEESKTFLAGVSFLSEDLTFHIPAISDPTTDPLLHRTEVQMEILSLGPFLQHHWSSQDDSIGNKYFDQTTFETSRTILNVSAQLALAGTEFQNFSKIFVEGLYNPLTGKMYLIGCRDVRASWKILFDSMDLENGLDCLVELVISYPPSTANWLVNPTAMISISSQRNEDDPLYFSPKKLHSVPIMYRKQREDILSRRVVEVIFRTLTLSLTVALILSQLMYMRCNVEFVPYISLVMLGVQAFGYSLPLIIEAWGSLQSLGSKFDESLSYDLDRSGWVSLIDFSVKVLMLVAFSLTMMLFQNVRRLRVKLLTQNSQECHRVPRDKFVLITFLAIHVVGYVLVLIIHSVTTGDGALKTERYIDSTGNFHFIREWETELLQYLGLVQDFFLLPQIIGNFLWQIKGQPLRRLYYIGITAIRLLPHLYDYVRSPLSNPYFSKEYEFVNPRSNFCSKFGDIAIPATAVVLATLLYVQQMYSREKIFRFLTFGRSKLLPWGSRAYEKVPTIVIETELSTGVHKEQDDT
ncbi:hypothetical protein Leryth_023717 [Lithospermum erythrorhizon]|nr:hypothetical protein Leryth_023717 [Lithospermum erythrorhizon]